jgi:hypothetical protein
MIARPPTSAIVRICAAVIVAALIIPAVPDVDLWGHTLFGGDIVRAGAIPAVDHYSFTSDRAWINHEWLSEVFMHLAYALMGGAGLGSLRLVLLALVIWIIWREVARAGATGEAALLILTILALVTYPRTQHMRPQLFSLVMFAALLWQLNAYERTRSALRLVSIPLLMLLWANLHGGFIVGFLPIGLWMAALAFEFRVRSSNVLVAAAILCGSVLATLLNPYGVDLWRFLFQTVGLRRDDITEWWPMYRAGTGVLTMWLVTIGMAIAGMRLQKRQIRWHHAALVGGFALASFRVNRLDAFFAIATAMCFGQPIAAFLAQPRRRVQSRQLAPQMAIVVLVVCVCGAGAALVRAAPQRDECVDTVSWLPEQDAAAFVARNDLRGRMIVFFNWGEYVLWHFSPNLKVSTDGRRETVYSDRHIRGHLELYNGTDAGLAYVRQLNGDYIWLPKSSPAIRRLQNDGWAEIYAGSRSVILAAEPLPPVSTVGVHPTSCFPGHSGRPSPLARGLWRKM